MGTGLVPDLGKAGTSVCRCAETMGRCSGDGKGWSGNNEHWYVDDKQCQQQLSATLFVFLLFLFLSTATFSLLLSIYLPFIPWSLPVCFPPLFFLFCLCLYEKEVAALRRWVLSGGIGEFFVWFCFFISMLLSESSHHLGYTHTHICAHKYRHVNTHTHTHILDVKHTSDANNWQSSSEASPTEHNSHGKLC